MRDWVRQLPITVGVPVAIALATVPPSAIGSVFSEYRQLVTPDVANWGLGVALIFAALYSPFAFQQRTSSLAAPEVAAPTAPILSKLPEPDEWVQNAVRLIVWGQWKAPIDGPISDVQASNVLHEASRCLVGIRQLAHSGNLQIWGRSDPGRLSERIPQGYWADHQIDILSVLDGRDASKTTTERTTHDAHHAVYEYLQVNAQEFEDRWFMPLSEAARQAYEATRGTNAARASEMLNVDGNQTILRWYSFALLGKTFSSIPLYGRHPPSRRLERISPLILPSATYSDDALTLVQRSPERTLFTDLAILRTNLDARIAEIREW